MLLYYYYIIIIIILLLSGPHLQPVQEFVCLGEQVERVDEGHLQLRVETLCRTHASGASVLARASGSNRCQWGTAHESPCWQGPDARYRLLRRCYRSAKPLPMAPP